MSVGPSESLIQLCRRYERWLTQNLTPEPGDWWISRGDTSAMPSLVGEGNEIPGNAVLIPRLEGFLQVLATECASFVLDYSHGEFACVAFDERGRSLANVVATDPSLAVAQALVFIRAERAANREKLEKNVD